MNTFIAMNNYVFLFIFVHFCFNIITHANRYIIALSIFNS